MPLIYYSQSQSREIASLRTRNVELEGDVERLRRQLTSEKFERWVAMVTRHTVQKCGVLCIYVWKYLFPVYQIN